MTTILAGNKARASDIPNNRPICKVRQTVAQTLTSSVVTAMTFDTEDKNDFAMHSTVTNPTRVTSVRDAWYAVSGNITYVANGTGVRTTAWRINGVEQPGAGVLINGFTGSTNRIPAVATLFHLGVGDYIELIGLQSSGGNLNTSVSISEQPHMSVWWVSD